VRIRASALKSIVNATRSVTLGATKKIAAFGMTVRAPLREASRSILTSPYAEELHLDEEASIWED
jgi:hypothetical protein